jgi:hypothetical protein
MESDTKNHIDLIRTCGQNAEDLHRRSKSSLQAQSQVVEEALKEFFERHNVEIEE